jgi:hypothetical protein
MPRSLDPLIPRIPGSSDPLGRLNLTLGMLNKLTRDDYLNSCSLDYVYEWSFSGDGICVIGRFVKYCLDYQ